MTHAHILLKIKMKLVWKKWTSLKNFVLVQKQIVPRVKLNYNISTPLPRKVFSSLNPPPLWKFHAFLYKLGFLNPPFPLGISGHLPWGGYGYFLELYIGHHLMSDTCYLSQGVPSHKYHISLQQLSRFRTWNCIKGMYFFHLQWHYCAYYPTSLPVA